MIVRVTLQEVNPRLAPKAVKAATVTVIITLMIVFVFSLIVAYFLKSAAKVQQIFHICKRERDFFSFFSVFLHFRMIMRRADGGSGAPQGFTPRMVWEGLGEVVGGIRRGCGRD